MSQNFSCILTNGKAANKKQDWNGKLYKCVAGAETKALGACRCPVYKHCHG